MNKQRQKLRPPLKVLIGWWCGALASMLLLVPTGAAVRSDFSGFRSCDTNTSGLYINNCGKASLNSGDILILGLFLGSLAIVYSLFIHSWRLTRRPA